MQEEKILLDGKEFFYRQLGKGPAVILLHGFGEEGSIWDQLYENFRGYRLIIPDLPGSGSSAMTSDMSMEGLALSIRNFLDLLQIGQCILIGHSMGGYITLAFAEKWPERLKGFGLFHSSAYADSEEKKETRKKGIRFMKENGAFAFLQTAIPNLYAPQSREKKPALVQQQVEASRHFSTDAMIAYYEAMMQRPDRTKILKETNLPVLFVIGKYDTAVPLADALQQCYLPALSHVSIFEESGHMGMREEIDRSRESLRHFVDSIKWE